MHRFQPHGRRGEARRRRWRCRRCSPTRCGRQRCPSRRWWLRALPPGVSCVLRPGVGGGGVLPPVIGSCGGYGALPPVGGVVVLPLGYGAGAVVLPQGDGAVSSCFLALGIPFGDGGVLRHHGGGVLWDAGGGVLPQDAGGFLLQAASRGILHLGGGGFHPPEVYSRWRHSSPTFGVSFDVASPETFPRFGARTSYLGLMANLACSGAQPLYR
ncbi:hypothetical protein ACP70R_024979 [Stipagrostis hirtigluma subsp. patula]